MLRALIFDVDGTLADTEELHRQAFNGAFLEMGLGWEWSRSQYKKLLEVSGGKERIAEFIGSLRVSEVERRALTECIPMIHQTKTRIYKERAEEGRLLFRPGVMRLLNEARAAGLRLGLATTTTLDNVRVLIDSAWGRGRLGWFDAVGAGDLVEKKKPAPDIYQLVLSTLRVQPEECVAFEDSVNGLKAARLAGLVTVVTPTHWNSDHDFDGANLLLPHLGDELNPLDDRLCASIGANALGLVQIETLLSSGAAHGSNGCTP
jgi:HAD superfamily hydrolase (TIGR01509 family)